MDEIAAMQACSRPDLSFMGNSGIILAGEDNDMMNVAAFSGGKQNGSVDASSQGSAEVNQGTFSLGTLAQLINFQISS